jgi:predicted flap endonuclease-1-like 5' DNA nuclease
MDLTLDGIWWIVPGFVLGWIVCWIVLGAMRAKPRVEPARSEPAVAATTPAFTEEPPDDPAPTMQHTLPRSVDVSAARAAGFNLKHDDDLTIIEGIGPKINDLLHANGVVSFAELSRLSVPETLDILERGGAHFHLANPGSWASQAALAAENRWSELKRLQEELVAGRPDARI